MSVLNLCYHLGKNELLEYLIGKVDINIRGSPTSATLLEYVVSKSDASMLHTLLSDINIDLNMPHPSGSSFFSFACSYNNNDIISMLIDDDRANLDSKVGLSGLMHLIHSKNYEMVRKLINTNRCDVNQIVTADLDDGEDSSTTPTLNALILAVSQQDEKMVSLLLSSTRIKPNKGIFPFGNPLYVAMGLQSHEILKLLVADERVEVNFVVKDGMCALLLAIQKGWTRTANIMIESKRSNVGLRDKNENTLLMSSISQNSEISHMILAEYGNDPVPSISNPPDNVFTLIVIY